MLWIWVDPHSPSFHHKITAFINLLNFNKSNNIIEITRFKYGKFLKIHSEVTTMVKAREKESRSEEESLTPLPLQRLFASKAIAKILDFLTLYRRYDYSKSDIAQEADVDWKGMLTRVWPILEHYDLVKHTRTVGRAQLYVANMDNPIMQTLVKLGVEIATYDNQKQLAKPIQPTTASEEEIAQPA